MDNQNVHPPSLWKFGGLTPLRLAQLAKTKIRKDELSMRSASLSYYFVLALFPMFLFLISVMSFFAGPGTDLRSQIVSALARLAPGAASEVINSVIQQALANSNGVKVGLGILGAFWAASGGTEALVFSLNIVHGVDETRSWRKKKLTVLLLTVALASFIAIALILVLYGGKLGHSIAESVGFKTAFEVGWPILRWLVVFAAMFLSYSVVYYFAPNLTDRKWHWVTPGAAAGVLTWLSASLGFKVYLHFFDNYTATYGSLGGAILLLLWLYISGFAVLIGAEVNWIIDQEDQKAVGLETKRRLIERQILTA